MAVEKSCFKRQQLTGFPVAQLVEHGANNAHTFPGKSTRRFPWESNHGFNSQGKQELVKCKTVT